MPRATKYFLLALALAALFIFRVEYLFWQEAGDTIAQFAGRATVVEGTVVAEPDVRDRSVRVVVQVATANAQGAQGRILVSLPREEVVYYNDRVVVRGVVELPEAFDVEAGREFDYPGYLRVQGVSALMPHATLREAEPGGWSLRGSLYALKGAFQQSLERALPEPPVSLLKGVLLGERGGFSQELIEVFVIAGLIHIVVFSGSNMAVVSEGIFRALGFLPRRVLYPLGAVAIVLVAMLAAGGAATVRAVIMGLIAIVARYLRRPAAALRALGVAGVLMVLWNPLVLLYDRGFVLSMLATFGLIVLAPWVERRLTLVPAWARYNVRSIVATTIAVEIFILPALLYYSGILSFVAVPMNALVLPLVPLVMFMGFVTGLAGLVHPALALLPALLTDALLRTILWLTEASAALPFASVLVAPFPAAVVLAVYAGLLWWGWRVYKTTAASSSKMRQSAPRPPTS